VHRYRLIALAAVGLAGTAALVWALLPDSASGTVRSRTIDAVPAPSLDATVTTTGTVAVDHHTLRVVAARRDLTGQGELGWVADSGYPVGDARCSQTVRIGTTPVRVRRTLLICWRTSAQRSVYTVAVDLDRPPSATDSVAALNRAWMSLG